MRRWRGDKPLLLFEIKKRRKEKVDNQKVYHNYPLNYRRRNFSKKLPIKLKLGKEKISKSSVTLNWNREEQKNVSRRITERIFVDAYESQFNGDYGLWKLKSNKTLLVDNLTGAGRAVNFVTLARSTFSRIIITLSSDTYISYYRDDPRLAEFRELRIEPLNHSEQEQLIRKRLTLVQHDKLLTDGQVDKVEDRVNSIIISRKIVPRYPFYVLSILQTYEGFMPDNFSISSFGHCYHALIVATLIKAGVSQKDSDINSCFNFAEHLSYKIYCQELKGCWKGRNAFDEFVSEYKQKFVIKDAMLNRLKQEEYGIISSDGNFRAKFMFYIFLGKYFARSRGAHEKEIAKLCEESYVNNNRLVLLFIIHHTNDNKIVDDILLRVMCSIEGVDPAVLDITECRRFYDIFSDVRKNILSEDSVESQRKKERQVRGVEEDVDGLEQTADEVVENPFNEMYSVLKCNQILGQILRNKFGSLERGKIAEIVETVADSGLRLVNSVLKNEEEIKQVALYFRQQNPNFEVGCLEQMIRFFSVLWTMANLERIVEAINVPEIREIVGDVVRKRDVPAFDLLGYFNSLDSAEGLSDATRNELKALLSKRRYPFMQNVLSLRTQHYMNTHVGKAKVEQSICSLLGIEYVHKLGRDRKSNV